MPECHKCAHNGRRHTACLTCPGPSDSSTGDVSLDAMQQTVAEEAVALGQSLPPQTTPHHVMAAFCFDLLQCSRVQLRVMSRRLLHPTESERATAAAVGVSRDSVSRTLADMTTRWPELRRMFSQSCKNAGPSGGDK